MTEDNAAGIFAIFFLLVLCALVGFVAFSMGIEHVEKRAVELGHGEFIVLGPHRTEFRWIGEDPKDE